MHFKHISAKIQLKNLKQHFDWGSPGSLGPPGYALGPKVLRNCEVISESLAEDQL